MYRSKDFESRFPPETKGMNYQFKRGRSFCERVTLLAGVKSQDYLFVMAESSAGSTSTKTITRVAVSLCSKEQICFPCAKQVINNDYRRRMIGSGRRKNKACLDLEILAGRQFTPTELTINIICRNCAEKNETIVNKVNLVTNSKRLSSDASGSSSKRSLLLQDAPQKQTSSEQEFMLLTRDTSTQADLFDSSEEESFVEVSILSLI